MRTIQKTSLIRSYVPEVGQQQLYLILLNHCTWSFAFFIRYYSGSWGNDGVGLLLSIILIAPFEHFEPAVGLFYLPYPVVS